MAENDPALSPYAKAQLFASRHDAAERDRGAKSVLQRISEDKRDIAYEEEKRKGYMRKYVMPLVNPYSPSRKEKARQVASEVKDTEDRAWIMSKVMQASQVLGKKKREDWNNSNFLQRWGDKLMEIPEAFLEGANEIAEAHKGLGRVLGGSDTDAGEMKYRDLMEAAYQYGDPKKTKEDNIAFKTLIGGAKLAPQILVGKAAYSIGGGAGLATQAGLQMFPATRGRLISEGVDPTAANTISSLTSAFGGAVEAAVPVPGVGRSGLGGVGKEVIGSAAAKLGAKGLKKKIAGTAGSAAAEYLGEVGEEFVQAGGEAVGSLAGGVVSGQTSGRSLAEVPREALAGARESALPLLPITMLGGGARIAGDVQAAKARAEIIEFADKNRAPSRKKWKELGLPAEEGVHAKQRLEYTKALADSYRAIDEIQVSVEKDVSAGEEVAIPDQPAELVEGIADIPDETAAIDARVEKVAAAKQARKADEKQKPPPSMAKTEAAVEPAVVDDKTTQQGIADLLAGESGAVPIGRVVDDTVAGMEHERAVEAMKSPDPEHEAAYVKSNVSEKGDKFWKRISNRLSLLGQATVRANKYIPNFGAKWKSAQESFRLLREAPIAARSWAARQVSSVIAKENEELGPTQVDLLERYLVTKNQIRSLDMVGEGVDKKTGERIGLVSKPEPLRHRVKSREAAAKYERQLRTLVEATPKVKAALDRRGKMVGDLVLRLVEELGMNPAMLDDVESYVHQEVLLYRNAMRIGQERQTGAAGWMRKRITGPISLDAEFDYNTSYIAPELAWMASAYEKLIKKDYNNALEKYSKTDEFTKQAESEERSLGSVARENGHTVTSRRKLFGNMKAGLTSSIQEQYSQAVQEDLNMTDEEVDLAVGGTGAEILVMPTEIVNQIKHDGQIKEPDFVEEVSKAMRNSWKAFMLIGPKNFTGHQLRNFVGDLDPVLATDFGMVKHMGRALKEVLDLQNLSKPQSKDSLNAERYGVIGSGQIAAEMGDVGAIDITKPGFGKYLSKNPLKTYTRVARGATEGRENILRYTAYLRYLEQLKSGKLSHYGAAMESTVKIIQEELGDEAAAAHMARNLLGDYSNLSMMGNWLRDHLLYFWSFCEINATRYPKILHNAFKSGKGRTATGAVLAKIAVFRIAQMNGALWVWNNLMYPMIWGEDDEEKLGDYDRNGSHILIGPNSDGTLNVFRNVGSFGELLSWFGVNEAASLLPRAIDGKIDWSDIGKEVLTAPLEKFISLLRPDYKAVAEVVGGKSYFPDPFNPRQVDRGEAAANIYGLSDELRQLKGAVTGNGQRWRNHYLKRFAVGVVDPGAAALSEMYSLRDDFLKQEGKAKPGVGYISEYKPGRDAAINDDKEAFFDWRTKFLEKHGAYKGGEKFWKHQGGPDPVSDSLNEYDRWKFGHEYLNTGQRERFRVAKEFSAKLQSRMSLWWVEAAKEKKNGF